MAAFSQLFLKNKKDKNFFKKIKPSGQVIRHIDNGTKSKGDDMTWDEWLHKVVKDVSEDQEIPEHVIYRLWKRIIKDIISITRK